MRYWETNPADAIDRPRSEPPRPKWLDPAEVTRLLDAFRDDPIGKRDRAITLLGVLTGRRRSELLGLTVGDLDFRNGEAFFHYRGKGGRLQRRELPAPCRVAIVEALAARGKRLEDMEPAERVFDTSPHGFYLNLQGALKRAGLPPAGVHLLRHTAARLRRDTGASVEEVSRFLDHASLATTATYLRRIEGDADDGWEKVAALLDT